MDNNKLNEVFEILEEIVCVYVNTGSSGEEEYGNYVEWVNLDTLDEDTLEQLCECLGIGSGETKENMIEKLRKENFPEETVYEGEENFPSSAKSFDENEYILYKTLHIDVYEYLDKIEEIKTKCLSSVDEIIKKALLLSAFSYTESYIKSFIVDFIPNIDDYDVPKEFKNIVKSYLDKGLKTHNTRQSLVKIFIPDKKLDSIPNIQIRNHLAHDMKTIDIIDDVVYFEDKQGAVNREDLEVVFDDLIDYCEELSEIKHY